jgi:hypothetical protein
MAEGNHRRGKSLGKFCGTAVSGGRCKTGQNFQKNGKPSWGKPYQAHHLLPVACVKRSIIKVAGKDPDPEKNIKGVLKGTDWCVNRVKNMMGMPIWGDTLEYYCKQHRGLKTLQLPVGPLFKDIPQHLVEHTKYSDEIDGRLSTALEGWKASNKVHELKEKNIAQCLNRLSGFMQRQLKKRGHGTHTAWKRAVKAYSNGKEYVNWYKPFSMAQIPSPKPFPVRAGGRTLSLIDRIAKGLLK